jgi:hypothetical protein
MMRVRLHHRGVDDDQHEREDVGGSAPQVLVLH